MTSKKTFSPRGIPANSLAEKGWHTGTELLPEYKISRIASFQGDTYPRWPGSKEIPILCRP